MQYDDDNVDGDDDDHAMVDDHDDDIESDNDNDIYDDIDNEEKEKKSTDDGGLIINIGVLNISILRFINICFEG